MIPAARTVEVSPITGADVPRVAEFLHANMNTRVPAERWASAIEVPWSFDKPNAGFMLLDGDTVAGAHLAFYSERTIDGRSERFCNLGAWCVLPEYRLYGIRLLKALLAQAGYHFTDLSPSGNVVKINARLGFRHLDATTALVPHLPWPLWPRRGAITSDPAVIGRVLTGRDLERFRDHVGTQAAHHLVLLRGDERCYVVFRRESWKRLRLFASILHVSNPGLFREMAGHVYRHMLVRHGVVAMLAEERIVKERPRLAFGVRPPRPRMLLSHTLDPDQVDYLYSELACLAW
jgi:hypothetical protein